MGTVPPFFWMGYGRMTLTCNINASWFKLRMHENTLSLTCIATHLLMILLAASIGINLMPKILTWTLTNLYSFNLDKYVCLILLNLVPLFHNVS